MRIACIIGGMSTHGGAERVMSGLCNHLLDYGHDVFLITQEGDGEAYYIDKRVIRKNLKAKHQISGIRTIEHALNLRKLIKKESIEVVISFITEMNIQVLMSLKGLNIPVIVSERVYPGIFKGTIIDALRNKTYKKAVGIVLQTEEAQKYFTDELQKNSTIIPNPIVDGLPIKDDYNRCNKVVAVGRLAPQKNYPFMLECFNEIVKRHPNMQLEIYGNGNLKETISEKIDNLKLNNNVSLMGVKDDINNIIKTADLYIMTSDYEGLSNSLAEAMAVGLPVVAVDCDGGGASFLIQDGNNGRLISKGDKDAFVNAVIELSDSESKRKHIGIEARAIREKLSKDKIFKDWNNYITQVYNKYYEHKKTSKARIWITKKVNSAGALGYLNWVSDKTYIKFLFRGRVGTKLNLKIPKTFSEKIQWLKLYDRKPIYTDMVDKYEAKNIATSIIGEEHIIPTLGVWDKPTDIDFDKLPKQFVLKCTHDSGGIVVCKDKDNLNIKKAKEVLNKSLKTNYFWNGREWPYKNVKPRIIAEKYMVDDNVKDGLEGLVDYKFFCFNGEPKFLYIAISNMKNGVKHGLLSYFNIDFTPAEFYRPDHEPLPYSIQKPQNYDKMVEYAKKLSEGIPFLRVDLYNVYGQIYFSEFTFAPGSGLAPVKPDEWEERLGSWIKLPQK